MWQITNLQVKTSSNNLENVVLAITCRYTTTYQGITDSWQGTISLVPPENNNFISYSQLNEQIIWKWLTTSESCLLGISLDRAAIEEQVLKNIKEQIQPTIINNIPPWQI